MDGGNVGDARNARNVRCDGCGCAFEPETEVLREEALEYTYFACPYCGRRHVASVTDPELRRRIRAQSLLAERHRKKRLPERTLRRMQRERVKNRARAVELRETHPLENELAKEEMDGSN